MNYLQLFIEILLAGLSIVGGSAVLATQTKNNSTNKTSDRILRAINVVGMNIGQAENKR
jgi:hypothetical protein